MRPKCTVFIAISLDGFIAREDGGIDWLDVADSLLPPGEDHGYGEHMATVDAMVMGRSTFETVLGFGGDWPYGDLRMVVLTRQPDYTIPDVLPDCVTTSGEAPSRLLTALAEEGVKHVYVDGGVTIQSFLAEGLIDEMTITTIPVILGTGIPLFGPVPADVPVRLVWSRSWEGGLVQSKWEVVRGGASDGYST